MKKLLFFIPIIVFGIYVYSSNTNAEISKDGIKFFKGTWTEALKKSESEHKPIFLDVSTSWCGYCKKMKRNAFSDKEVGSYFNSNFINVEVDAEVGEGISIANSYSVNSYPTLIIVDHNGKVIRFSEGYLGSKDLIHLGKSGLEKVK